MSKSIFGLGLVIGAGIDQSHWAVQLLPAGCQWGGGEGVRFSQFGVSGFLMTAGHWTGSSHWGESRSEVLGSEPSLAG